MRLESRMSSARNSVEIKRKVLVKFTEEELYPYTKFYLRAVYERFGKFWQNHFSTIGLVGLNEACLNLFGEDIGTDRGMAFAERWISCAAASPTIKRKPAIYNLEATPAEGTTYRLAQLDAKLYQGIISAAGNNSEPFYSNSTQLPVSYSGDIFRVLDLQDNIQTKYTGGTVLHVFTGEAVSDPEAVKAFVRTVCQNYRLPYFTVTPTFSVCEEHGYISGEHYECPKANPLQRFTPV